MNHKDIHEKMKALSELHEIKSKALQEETKASADAIRKECGEGPGHLFQETELPFNIGKCKICVICHHHDHPKQGEVVEVDEHLNPIKRTIQ